MQYVRIQLLVMVTLLLGAIMPVGRAGVVINEIKASSSDRMLRWTPDGVSRLGVGEPWYGTSFDDSSWNTGQGPLGYGVAGLNTTIDTGGARSFYVRKTFTATAADAASTDDLVLSLNFDDGVVVYLNGKEVLRKSLGAPGLCIAHDHFAYNIHDYGADENYSLGQTSDLIHEGENTLAIQVHNVDIAHFQIPPASDSLALGVGLQYSYLVPALVSRDDTFRFLPGYGEPSGGEGDGREFYDWIELYNNGAAAVALSGWALTTDPSKRKNWVFPDVVLGAGEYLVVFASEGASPTLPLQADFRLSSKGEYLALVNPSGVVEDAFEPAYPPQNLFYSYGRVPGGGFAYFANPTAGAENDPAGSLDSYLAPPVFNVDSGLYETPFELTLSAEEGAEIWYGMTGPAMVSLGGAHFEFNRTGDREGWQGWNGTSNLRVSDGALSFDTTGPDPHVGGPPVQFSAETYHYIDLRFKTTTTGTFQIFWTTSVGGWSEERSIKFQVDTPDTFITKVVNMAYLSAWNGMITQLRFDQAPGDGVCTIDFFRVTDAPETEPVVSTGIPPEAAQRVPGREPDLNDGLLYEGPIIISSNTVVRARAVKEGCVSSPVTSRSFLFNTGLPGDDTEALRSLPVLSIMGDQERSLVTPHGFMSVVGGSYSGQYGWWVSGGIDDYNNPIMHGRPYEGPVAVSIFDPVTNEGVDLDAGMRMGRSDVARPSFRWVPGHWRDRGKWSFRLEFRNDYGQEWLEYPLQPGEISNNRFRSIALRTFGADPRNPYASEEITRRIQIAMGSAGAYGTYVNLFINGQYKCYINVCDRLTEAYFQNYFDSDNEWDVIKSQVNRHFQPVLELHSGTFDAWDQLIAFVRGHDLADLANYREIEKQVDLPQFIDWILTNVYAANADWPWNNWIAARERVPESQWRFYIWDADFTFQHINNVQHPTLNNMENQGNEINVLYRALKRSPEFRLLFQDRVQKHCYGDGVLTQDRLMAIFNEIRATLEPMVTYMYGTPYNTWIPDNWFPYRTSFLLEHVAALGYAPALDAPTYTTAVDQLFMTNPNTAGTVVYTLDGTDPRLPRDATVTALVPGGSPKRVLIPAEDMGAGWYDVAPYDDTVWIAGSGAVGYENGSGYQNLIGIDVGSEMAGARPGCYVRIPFTLTADDLAAGDILTLGLQYDDGCVAYLNGVEVCRVLAPNPAAWNAFATGAHEATAGFEEFDISPFRNLLRTGDNLLALHGLNFSLGSTDFLLDARLVLSRVSNTALAPSARVYSQPLPARMTTPVRARVYDDESGAWSPLIEIPATAEETHYDWLKLTEIMYHPPAGGAEFLELRNVGAAAINIGGVYFSAGVTFTFPENTILGAGEYIVLVRSTVDFTAAYPGIAVGGVYQGNLDNAGETITLRDPAGNLLVRVTYGDTPPWAAAADGQGFSLVIIDPLSDSGDAANWRASGPVGGTPGGPDIPAGIPAVLVNEALTHTDPPEYDSMEIYNPTDADADIRGWYLTDDRMTPRKARVPFEARYVIPPGGYAVITAETFGLPDGDLTGFNLSSLGGEDAYIFSADANGNLTGYSHGFAFGGAANGVSFGRYVTSEGKERFVAQRFPTLGGTNAGPLVGPVVISAIYYHPPEGATPEENGIEYVELTNLSDEAVPLWDNAPEGNPENTYELEGIGFRFPMNTVLPAFGHALVVNTDPATFRATHFVPGGTRVYGPFGNAAADGTGNLANEGEAVTLLWPDEPNLEGNVAWIIMDKVRYNDKAPWPDASGNGMALVRRENDVYGNDPINWTAAESFYVPGGRAHSADLDGDGTIGTSELLRVIQHYRAGALACEDPLAPTDDRYLPGATTPRNCEPHAGDYAPQDWRISLRELLRLVQFHNAGGYHYCPTANTEDTFCVDATP